MNLTLAKGYGIELHIPQKRTETRTVKICPREAITQRTLIANAKPKIAPELIFAGGSFVPTFLLETAATMSNPKPHLNPVFAIPYLPGFPLVPTLAN